MDIWQRIGVLIENRVRLVIIITLLLIAPAAVGLTHLKSDNGLETTISTDSAEYQAYDRFSEVFSSETIVVLVEGENLNNLLDPQNIAAMASIEDRLNAYPSVVSAIGPGFLVKQASSAQTGEATIPNDPQALQEMILDAQTGEIKSGFRAVFPDSHHAMIAIIPDGTLSREDLIDMVDVVDEAVGQVDFKGVKPIVTGMPVLTKEGLKTQSDTMGTLILVSVALMLAILIFIFRVRNHFAWRWLPLGAVLIGVVYTFGIMGFAGIPITMVTTSSVPVLIGLGADYAIQFHNRYDEEARRGETFSKAVIDSVRSIGPAVGIAIVIASMGFAGLFFSSVPMVQDFGLTLIIGVICCYLVSLTFMVAVLYWNDRRKGTLTTSRDASGSAADSKSPHGFVESGLRWLAPRVLRHPAIIIPIAIVLGASGMILDGKIGSESDTAKFMSSDLQYIKDLKTLEVVVGGRTTASIFIQSDGIADPEILTWIAGVEEKIRQNQEGVVYSTSSLVGLIASSSDNGIPETAQEARYILDDIPPLMKRNLVNEDYTAANLVLNLRVLDSDEIKQLKKDLESYVSDPPDSVSATVTGSVIVQNKMIEGLTGGREQMTFLGGLFVFCGLLVLFRLRWVRALMAALPIILIVGWSAIVMYLAGIDFTPVTATMGALIVGIGVEFTVLLMMRYYEEKAKGQSPAEAMTTAITKIGRAIIASGLTVIGGFGALLMAFDFPILQDFGMVTMINVIFALISTLVVLPPLIVWVETKLPVRLTGNATQR